MVPIGHDFHLFGHGKVLEKAWKMIFQKEWSPWVAKSAIYDFLVAECYCVLV